jgi:starch-binding outer membrane protein, SusD/RagB family
MRHYSKYIFINFIFSVVLFFVLNTIAGCKKMVDVESPDNKLEAKLVYSKDATAAAAVTGIYFSMNNLSSFAGGFTSVSVMAGLSADELKDWAKTRMVSTLAYQNKLTASAISAIPFWSELYKLIYASNSAIEGLSASNTLTPSVKNTLLGEAKFMRAFGYFYLVNLWGEVPVNASTDFKENSLKERDPVQKVYDQIIKDLQEAHDLLSDQYLLSDIKTITEERIRPNKWAAKAMLARVYLYQKNYSAAEQMATEILDNTNVYDTVPLSEVFLKNSKEAIWQLQPVASGWNTNDARIFVSTGAPNYQCPFTVSDRLISAFESNDKRKINWINNVSADGVTYPYPYKYKEAVKFNPVVEYSMILRVAEQYLIRAEARAHLNNIEGAQNDLNIIRKRAGLVNTSACDMPALLMATEQERRVELFSEWGHRWLDLKRTDRVDAVMSEVTLLKGGEVWNHNKALFPISQEELQNGINLKQNPGYQ